MLSKVTNLKFSPMVPLHVPLIAAMSRTCLLLAKIMSVPSDLTPCPAPNHPAPNHPSPLPVPAHFRVILVNPKELTCALIQFISSCYKHLKLPEWISRIEKYLRNCYQKHFNIGSIVIPPLKNCRIILLCIHPNYIQLSVNWIKLFLQ